MPAAPEEPDSFKETQREGLTRALGRLRELEGKKSGRAADARLLASRMSRVRQALARLERLPDDAGKPQVVVNIAGQWLRAARPGRSASWMKVVIGRPESPTPEMSSRIERVVLNPAWVIPPGPALETALAAVQRHPAYLEERNIQVLENGVERDPRGIAWAELSTAAFHYRLRQQPGPTNPLGRVEFMFPNRRAIHLHDTPQKSLFAEAERAASLGCVRVEKPFELAALLLADTPWTRERLGKEAGAGFPRTLWLPSPVELHIVNWQAWIDSAGELRFAKEPAPPPR